MDVITTMHLSLWIDDEEGKLLFLCNNFYQKLIIYTKNVVYDKKDVITTMHLGLWIDDQEGKFPRGIYELTYAEALASDHVPHDYVCTI